jgi:hypothetical protein
MEKKIEEKIKLIFTQRMELWDKWKQEYLKVLEHRKNCDKWGKSFCLECFGGGLTKFTERIIGEQI